MKWEVIQGDCLEVLKSFAPGSFDAVITDPPYGIDAVVARMVDSRVTGDGDTAARDSLLEMVGSIPALVFGSWKATKPTSTRMTLIWDKGELVGMGDLTMPWKPTHEEIYVIGSGFSADSRRGSVLRFPVRLPWTGNLGALTGSHPTEKPLSLMRYLVSVCPGHTILDPFCGSGTTGVACAELGRDFCGIEISEEYAAIARRRIEAATRQGKIDFPNPLASQV